MFFLIILLFVFLNSEVNIQNLEVKSFTASDFDTFDPLFSTDYSASLKRGKVNIYSEWIALEKDYDSLYVYNISDPSLKFEFLKKGARNKKKNYYADNIFWSHSYDNIFFFRHYDSKKKEWSFESAEFSHSNKVPFYIEEPIYPNSYHADYIDDLKIDYIHLANYKNDNFEDVYYLIISNNLNDSQNKMIVTNYYNEILPSNSDLWAIYDSENKNPKRNFYSRIFSDDKLVYPREIQTIDKHFPINGESNDFLQSAITFKSDKLFQENDIYYFCDIYKKRAFSENTGYHIFPRNESYFEDNQYYPFCNQFSPRFNFDGTKIAFLNQTIDSKSEDICPSDESLIDLWVFDLSVNFDEMCLDQNSYNGNYDGAYSLISKKVLNIFAMDESELSEASDFVWHPNQDIIFYIDNRIKNEKGEIKNDIYYYDFLTSENKMLDTGTEYNRYISISDDGNYLTFSFKYTDDNNSYVEGDCINCTNPYFYKTAIAKINIDE